MADNRFYVYKYVLEDGTPYYIGKGCGNRINKPHTRTVLPAADRRIIIQNGLTNDEAKLLEGQLISEYKRKIDGGILDNIKINQWACHTGWKHSEETKQKISIGNRGKIRTEEQINNYKKPKSKEHAEKIRQANIGRPYDPVRAAKISSTLKLRHQLKKQQELTNGNQ
jgi:hypothetical protein